MGLSFHDGVTNYVTASASSGTSAVVDLGGGTLCGVFISTDTHKGTSISFSASPTSNGTFHNVLTSTGETVSISGVSTQEVRYYAVNATNYMGLRFIKLVSSSTQEQTTAYSLATRPM